MNRRSFLSLAIGSPLATVVAPNAPALASRGGLAGGAIRASKITASAITVGKVATSETAGSAS